ncbi:MAG: divergent polysaccharide deacetylase family protein [Desulfovibrionaceae bacterium]
MGDAWNGWSAAEGWTVQGWTVQGVLRCVALAVLLALVAGCGGDGAGSGAAADGAGRAKASAVENPPMPGRNGGAMLVATRDADGGAIINGLISQDAQPYEESLGGPVEDNVRRIDVALLRAMDALDLPQGAMELRDVAVIAHKTDFFHFQTIVVRTTDGGLAFLAELRRQLHALGTDALVVEEGRGAWSVSVLGRQTHRLLFAPSKPGAPIPPVAPLAPAGGAQLVVVIDDLGENVAFARKLAALDFPVTFSVWPQSTHAAEVARLAHEAGREVLIHQPMEPQGYPRIKPGAGALLVEMDAARIAGIMSANLDRVPFAVGVNNHMGSRFTQDEAGLAATLGVLKARGLFMLDSFTHPASQVVPMALRVGVPVYKRDVFLDVVRDTRAILHQLEKAAAVALHNGRAIAIGHPNRETLEALERWQRSRDRRVAVTALASIAALTPESAPVKAAAY